MLLSKVVCTYVLFLGLMLIVYMCLTFAHLYSLSAVGHVKHGKAL